MVRIRAGSGHYGSEHHLLRYLGRHRRRLNTDILSICGKGSGVDWLDFNFASKPSELDEEWKGLDFLSENDSVQKAWSAFWPQRRGIHNWDAVGLIDGTPDKEWLLVEAKAHLGEIKSDCKAKGHGRAQIQSAFDATKKALGVAADRDWLNGYYQYCNRLAVIHFLSQHGIKAHLLFLYFVGDKSGKRRECPGAPEQWNEALKLQEEHIGLPKNHTLAECIHKLFLPVCAHEE